MAHVPLARTAGHLEAWVRAHADHLRNDPQGRDWSTVLFEGKGYPPRNPDSIFEPLRPAEKRTG